MKDSRATVYILGSERISRLLPALGSNFSYDVYAPGDSGRVRNFLSIRDKIASAETDLVLTDNIGTSAVVAGELCRRHDVPFIVRPRGGMWNEFSDRLSDRSGPMFVRAMRDKLVRNRVYKLADTIVPVSYFHRTQILYETTVDPTDITVIYEPVNPSFTEGVEQGKFKEYLNLDDETNLVVAVTNFDYQDKSRAIPYFYPALDDLLVSNPNLHLAVVGGGNRLHEVAERIESLATQTALERIHFTGYYDAIAQAFIDADVVTHLSFRDTMGLDVLEAQISKSPIVVNPDGGMRELLPPGTDDNQLVRNPSELRETFDFLLDSPDVRKELGIENHAWTKQQFSVERISNEFRDVLADAL